MPVGIILLTVLTCIASLTAAIGCLCGYYCWRRQRGSEERVPLRAEQGVVPIALADEVANVFAKE